MASHVGRRLKIQWRGDTGEPWYSGVVGEYMQALDTHVVHYDDGEHKEHNLAEEAAADQLRWLDAEEAATTTTTAPNKRRRTKQQPEQQQQQQQQQRQKPPPAVKWKVVKKSSQQPQQLLETALLSGKRLRVFWPDDEKWFSGTVTGYSRSRGHQIKFDRIDGEDDVPTSYYDLSTWLYELEDPPADAVWQWSADGVAMVRHEEEATAGAAGAETSEDEAPPEWNTEHPFVGQLGRCLQATGRVPRISRKDPPPLDACVNGRITKWLPAGNKEDEPALFRFEHETESGDEEDLEEDEAVEHLAAMRRGLYQHTLKDLIARYAAEGVRYLTSADDDGKHGKGETTVKVVKERLPLRETSWEAYFSKVDIYVGNMYGHTGGKFDLASLHVRHKTTSCRDPFVVVLPKQESPRPYLRCNGWRNCYHVKEDRWPKQHPASASILGSGDVNGGMIRSQAIMFAAILWPATYEFIEPRPDDWNFDKVVKQNDGVVTHMLGEAVMPAVAREVMRCAAADAATASSSSSSSSTPLTALVDLFCCGGGFSLGAIEALPGLRQITGVDTDPIVLRNYEHNLRRLMPDSKVVAMERKAPTSFASLCTLLGKKQLGAGTHIHCSPPCQSFIRNGPQKLDVSPYFQLMLDACQAGCSCSLEEHVAVFSQAQKWLETQPEESRRRFYVYNKLSARDYGSPTGRERCVVTTFPLAGELNRNLASAGEGGRCQGRYHWTC